MVIGMENVGNRITYLPDGKYDFSHRLWFMGTRHDAYNGFYILLISFGSPLYLAQKTKTQTHPERFSRGRRSDYSSNQ
tara:strand:- start:117 stop:350 length:234 start_codon:yes stop_codon:yes gene_type:complete